ncbi:MAG: hypothetical protein K8F30_08620 [Taibaiella sp.]|nr:hypothetical protein [Taibaiella sp.]
MSVPFSNSLGVAEGLADVLRRLFVGLFPLLLASLIEDVLFQFIVTALSLVWFFWIAGSYQSALVELPYIRTQMLSFLMMSGLLFWSAGIAHIGKGASLGIAVFCGSVAVIVSLWSAIWRFKRSVAKPTKLPFPYIYWPVCVATFSMTLMVHYERF